MSTKIHNGYRLRNQTIQKLMPALQAFAEQIVADNTRSMAKLIAYHAVDIMDRTALGMRPEILLQALYMDQKKAADHWIGDGTGKGYSPLQIAAGMCRQLVTAQKGSNNRNPRFDFQCRVSIMPLPTRLMACLFTERESHRKIWERQPGVVPYPYWNHTDEPKGITRAQWNARGREWDQALGDHGVPAMAGLTFDAAVDSMWILPREKLVCRMIPSWDDRIREHAENLAMDMASKKFRRVKDDLGRFWKASDYLRTDAGKALLAKAEQRVSRKLQPDITAADLRKPITLVPKPEPKPIRSPDAEKESGK